MFGIKTLVIFIIDAYLIYIIYNFIPFIHCRVDKEDSGFRWQSEEILTIKEAWENGSKKR